MICWKYITSIMGGREEQLSSWVPFVPGDNSRDFCGEGKMDMLSSEMAIWSLGLMAVFGSLYRTERYATLVRDAVGLFYRDWEEE
jgi:hypothetical protein